MEKSQQYDFSSFVSVKGTRYSFSEMIQAIFDFIQEYPDRDYKILLGSDSEGYGEVPYATAVVVHRVGNGGNAFVCKNKISTSRSLRHKIHTEATLSLTLAHEIVPHLTEKLGEEFVFNNLVIHIDVGQHGETKDMIREITGMVRGSGFQVETKPNSCAASSVADRFASPPSAYAHGHATG